MLPLILVAGVAGLVIRRTVLSALTGILVGYVGAAAIILRLSPQQDQWSVVFGTLGSFAAIPCAIAACLAPWFARSDDGSPHNA